MIIYCDFYTFADVFSDMYQGECAQLSNSLEPSVPGGIDSLMVIPGTFDV